VSAILDLSRYDVRRMALYAQGLLGRPYSMSPGQATRAGAGRRIDAVHEMLEHLGAVQLDTISVLARNHELVPYARLGAIGRGAVETAYWGSGEGLASVEPARTFEYWSHAACILPVSSWPLFAFRRRAYRRRGVRWHDVPTAALGGIRQRLRDEGPLTTRELGGAKRSGEWWDWSESKIAIEWLLDVGDVVCVRRVGFRRVYDLAERAIPEPRFDAKTPDGSVDTWTTDDDAWGPADAVCVQELVRRSMRSLGVGTIGDIVDVHRLTIHGVTRAEVMTSVNELVDQAALVEVAVPGWTGPVYADSEGLVVLAAGEMTGRARTTLLSPFDSLVWHRGRTSRVFGFDHRLEAYTPAAKREHGYFSMPVLHGGRLVARVDPKRDGSVLTARHVVYEVNRGGRVPQAAVDGTAAALREAAAWVGCSDVRVMRTTPAVR